MSLLVKICGVTTPDAIDAAVSAGADMIGLVFFPRSPRHLSLATARSLAERAAGRARIVALTVDATDEDLETIVSGLAPDVLQLHGGESPERVAAIRSAFGRPVMKAVGVAGETDLAAVDAYAVVSDMLLVDAKPPKTTEALPGGNGLTFDWRLVAGLDPGRPVMLSGGLHSGNVAEAVRLTRLSGVDVSSGVESTPGRKDPDRIRAFVAAARSAQGEGERE
ncbi:phosphoribosylanthranilate isomerase [Phreatobacter cathodiphilus]|uniref:N-(5'-phosphoribosyl)anthranilate isomerase n=1 Tax=Phreatobacter cathodiphilus TaxID=1868589 RepID=A0A2S0N7T7_9HYPH|nr:phosphoribosylanthranilate isomerase [Phreatobacter cathodiphilus]AVO44224.1 phosphoribosylanthranilate isomerase [Phreatobacter cathodiphilus]